MITRMILAVLICLTSYVLMAIEPIQENCVISNALGRVEVSLKGARVMSWRDATGVELLFMPEKESSEGAEWSHGGIPLCWPWFGRRDGLIHGFIRTKRFTVVRRNEDGVLLRYSLSEREEPSFPHAAEIEVEIKLSKRLSVVLRTRNQGKEPFDFTCGIHPYVAVTDYRCLTFTGVDTTTFDCVCGMDKAFPRSCEGRFGVTDKASKRTLLMSAVGNSHVILWSPGTAEPANRNLRPEDMVKFIGYGPAITKVAGAIHLSPGMMHELAMNFLSERTESVGADPAKSL